MGARLEIDAEREPPVQRRDRVRDAPSEWRAEPDQPVERREPVHPAPVDPRELVHPAPVGPREPVHPAPVERREQVQPAPDDDDRRREPVQASSAPVERREPAHSVPVEQLEQSARTRRRRHRADHAAGGRGAAVPLAARPRPRAHAGWLRGGYFICCQCSEATRGRVGSLTCGGYFIPVPRRSTRPHTYNGWCADRCLFYIRRRGCTALCVVRTPVSTPGGR